MPQNLTLENIGSLSTTGCTYAIYHWPYLFNRIFLTGRLAFQGRRGVTFQVPLQSIPQVCDLRFISIPLIWLILPPVSAL